MPKARIPLTVTGFLLLIAVAAPAQEPAATPTPRPTPGVLETAALRLEVQSRPYRYKLVEKSSGTVLVQHAGTDIRFGDITPEARNLAGIDKTPDGGLDAQLGFSNTGKRAHIRFRFTSPEVLQVRITYEHAKLENVTETFQDQGEHYYGLWEHVDGGIDNRGVDQEMLGLRHVQDVNYPSARAPFYVTSRGYGIYTQSDARGRYKIAIKGETIASFDDDKLQYSIIYGPSYAQILERYNKLSGGSFMPPLWAFDSIWWRDDHHKDWEENGVKSSQELVLKDAEALRAHRIPSSAIWLDRPFGTGRNGWGNMDFDETFPNPKAMIDTLRDQYNMGLVIWIANRTANRMLQEGVKAGYVFSPDIYTEWPAADVRKPPAYEWFKKNLDAYVSLGVKGYKIDRGEEAEMPDAEQNRLITLFAKLSKEGLEARHPGDTLVFARNVYDTGRKYTAVWDGDTESTWPGMISSVKHAVRCGAINMPMWGSDVGGYHRGNPSKELFTRWLQLGAYSTMMEVKIGANRTPWLHYDEEMIEIARAQAAAHHDLIPYTRSALHLATRTGMPVLRQLLFDHPDDSSLYETWDEYMFGPSILVAPVLKDGARQRPVYLPKGRWMDYNDRKTVYAGGATINAMAPLAQIPLFVKEGAIVTRGDILRSNNAWVPRWQPYIKMEVFAPREGKNTFDYFTGSAVAPITSVVEKGNLELTFPDLGTPGYVEVFIKAPQGPVVINGKTVTEGDGMTYDPEKQALIFQFRGETRVTVGGVTSLF